MWKKSKITVNTYRYKGDIFKIKTIDNSTSWAYIYPTMPVHTNLTELYVEVRSPKRKHDTWEDPTPKEIRALLITEARSRFSEGDTVTRPKNLQTEYPGVTSFTQNYVIKDLDEAIFDYNGDLDSLYVHGKVIYHTGSWSSVVQPELTPIPFICS